MPAPTDREQVEFLSNLQRLLAEGQYTSTYKFALLLSLGSITIEQGDDSGNAMTVSLDAIAEKFVELYLRQAAPHPAGGVLAQNTDRQAAIITLLAQQRRTSLSKVRKDRSMIRKVAAVVKAMPLLKLQTVGGGREQLIFLYANEIRSNSIELLPGVAFCLRRFHHLIVDLVEGAWVRFVRRLPANRTLIGDKTDLSAFLFGSERNDLSAYVPILRDLQHGACFYCGKTIRSIDTTDTIDTTNAVDHFVPWSMFRLDFGHNFVLADKVCNTAKRDVLAGTEHLLRWWSRNQEHGNQLAVEFDRAGIVHDQAASARVTMWAYENSARTNAKVWIARKEFAPLAATWRTALV